jgi:hypothetical protein
MESTFSNTFIDLYKEVLEYQGSGRDTVDADKIVTAKRRVNDAYRKFLALDWEFLGRHSVLKVEAGKNIYELPDDYGVIRVPFKLKPYQGWANPQEIPTSKFWTFQSFYPRLGIPLYYTFHTEYDVAKGLRFQVHFYPTPHIAMDYNWEYKLLPNKLVNDADIPYCPANISHVLKEFCLAEVELFDEEGQKTAHTNNLYNVLLPQAINENSIRSPESVGNMNGDISDGNWPTIHPMYGNTLGINGLNYPI